MKKAQILGALALAFALGVAVIPTASTYAKVVKTDPKTNALVTDEEATAKLEKAIEEGKGSCGWHLIGEGNDAVKTWYYDQYLALNDVLESMANKIEEQEKYSFDGSGTDASGNSSDSLKKTYADVMGVLKTAVNGASLDLPVNLKLAFTEDVTNYSEAVSFIQAARTEMANQSTRYSSNTTVATAYRTAAEQLENALNTAADDIKNVMEWASDRNIQPEINKITGGTTIDTNVTYAQAVTKANDLTSDTNGFCSIKQALNIKKAVDYAEGILKSSNSFYASDAEKAIANITKAINGTTVTDDDVKQPTPADEGNKAPDTGILSNEDGGASTTVAMVAGVATALTAAGAGVVAYRNARRSSRK